MQDKRLPDDFREDLHISRSKPVRYLYMVVGTFFLVLGLIGIIIPVLPTTPFLLVTAACYSRGSARFYHWLMNHRYMGPYLKAWRYERRIPRHAKIAAFVMIAISISFAVIYVIPLTPVKILVAAVGITVAIYISRFPD